MVSEVVYPAASPALPERVKEMITNLRTSALGGIAAPQVTDSGNADRPFAVDGDTFANRAAAVQRACAIQNNQCANAVNSGAMQGSSVGDCNAQQQACNAAA